MSNRLKMTKVQAVMALHERGWSQRKIAVELGIDRETVSRYLLAKPAIVHTGSQGPDEAKPAIVHTGLAGAGDDKPTAAEVTSAKAMTAQPNGHGHVAGRLSACAPFRELIQGKLEQGLSAQRIW